MISSELRKKVSWKMNREKRCKCSVLLFHIFETQPTLACDVIDQAAHYHFNFWVVHPVASVTMTYFGVPSMATILISFFSCL
jgi:hypothetical protein